jgi:hypothetical protein
MSTLLLEVILVAIMGPETVRLDVSTLDALRVPPMKASLVTEFRLVIVRLDVSTLEALRVPPMKASLVTEFRLMIVRLDDSILEVLRL